MAELTDAQLLHRFVAQQDQRAFAEVVHRHATLVYSAAMHHVMGDRATAQDIAQQVFSDLAHKAGQVAGHPSLAGWLYASTRFSARDVRRREQRRTERERAAHLMHACADEPQWDKIRPVLDTALDELEERDRESVLLRFFGERSFRAIGEQLGLSENAAQKRVERSLDRVHAALVRRGITGTAAALATALAHAQTIPPPGLVRSFAEQALSRGVTTAKLAGTGAKTWATWVVAGGAVTALIVGLATDNRQPASVADTLAQPTAMANSGGVASTRGQVAGSISAIAAPEVAAANAAPAPVPPPQTRQIVKFGDTGAAIAQRWGVSPAALLAANPGYDFSLMAPGDQVVIPPGGKLTEDHASVTQLTERDYLVKTSDTAATIAAERGLTLEQLADLNPKVAWSRLHTGQIVRVK